MSKIPKINHSDTLDNLLEGCQIIGKDFRYLYVNDVVAKQGKKTKEELLGNKMSEVYPGIETTEMFSRLKKCIKKKDVQIMENEFRFPDGSIGWFELRMEPLPEGVFILSIDITDRKLAEQKNTELNEIKNKFIKIVSHQLRTPLSSVRWTLEQLLNGDTGKLSEIQRQTVRMAHQAGIEVINRIGDLLTALDIEKERLVAEKEEIHIEGILKYIISEHRSDLKLKSLQCNVIYPETSLPPIWGDAVLVRGIISKLLENAIVYTKNNGIIKIQLIQKDATIYFEITDTGIGIPKQEQHRIFKRFFRASNSFTMHPDGSGLGLYLASHFTKLHNGKMGFSSEEGKGSTFWVEIPVELSEIGTNI